MCDLARFFLRGCGFASCFLFGVMLKRIQSKARGALIIKNEQNTQRAFIDAKGNGTCYRGICWHSEQVG